MKAGLLRAPNDLTFEEVEDPACGPGDLLVKMRAATICGTDIRVFRGRKTAGIRYPSIIGHEFAGEIVQAHAGSGFESGQRVCVNPAVPCGHCDCCKTGCENICENLVAFGYEIDGAFAEYVRVPAGALAAGNVHVIPDHIGFEQAALTEPLACVINGQEQISIGVGDAVLVLGAGPIGLLHVKLACRSGARLVIVSEPSAARRQAALSAGADLALDPATDDLAGTVRDTTRGMGVDAAVVAVGVPSLVGTAMASLRRRGRVNLFAGFPPDASTSIDVNMLHYKELVMTGSFGLRRRHFDQALELITQDKIDVASLVTTRFGLSAITTALAAAEQGGEMKVALISD